MTSQEFGCMPVRSVSSDTRAVCVCDLSCLQLLLLTYNPKRKACATKKHQYDIEVPRAPCGAKHGLRVE